jgi:hypothetical protein
MILSFQSPSRLYPPISLLSVLLFLSSPHFFLLFHSFRPSFHSFLPMAFSPLSPLSLYPLSPLSPLSPLPPPFFLHSSLLFHLLSLILDDFSFNLQCLLTLFQSDQQFLIYFLSLLYFQLIHLFQSHQSLSV